MSSDRTRKSNRVLVDAIKLTIVAKLMSGVPRPFIATCEKIDARRDSIYWCWARRDAVDLPGKTATAVVVWRAATWRGGDPKTEAWEG